MVYVYTKGNGCTGSVKGNSQKVCISLVNKGKLVRSQSTKTPSEFWRKKYRGCMSNEMDRKGPSVRK